MPLSDEDIQKIIRAVRAQLQGQGDVETIARTAAAVTSVGEANALTIPGTAPQRPPVGELGPSAVPLSSRPSGTVHPELERTEHEGTRVIVAAFGKNRPGVAAALTNVLAEHNCDIADITQKILQEFFSMIMIVDMTSCTVDFATLKQRFAEIESRLGITIVAQHEEIFRAMHRI